MELIVTSSSNQAAVALPGGVFPPSSSNSVVKYDARWHGCHLKTDEDSAIIRQYQSWTCVEEALRSRGRHGRWMDATCLFLSSRVGSQTRPAGIPALLPRLLPIVGVCRLLLLFLLKVGCRRSARRAAAYRRRPRVTAPIGGPLAVTWIDWLLVGRNSREQFEQ